MGATYRCDDCRSAVQVSVTIAAYLAVWALALWSAASSAILATAWGVAIGIFNVRIFNLEHDCSHHSYFSSDAVNDAVGSLLGIATLTPYHYWQSHHLLHHGTSGNLDRRGKGDIAVYTVEEFARLSWPRRVFYRLYRNPLVMLTFGPLIHFALKMRIPFIAKAGTKQRRSIHLVNAAWLAIYLSVFRWYPSPGRFVLLHLVAVMVGGAIGLWLFYVQHQFERGYWRRGDQWNFWDAARNGSSHLDLPVPVAWFFAHINLHHVHHLDPKIPNYLLTARLATLPPSERAGNVLTVRDSIRAFRLKLWDERAQKLVGYPRRSARW